MELMDYQLTTRQSLWTQQESATGNPLSAEQSQLYFLPSPSITGKTGKTQDSINVWKRLSQELKNKNKKFINFLQIRASVITHWLAQYNLCEVQYRAGHRYVSTTESYLVNQMEDLQKDIEDFNPIG